MIRRITNYFKKSDGDFEQNSSRFRQALRDWDRLAALTFFGLYASWSLAFGPISVLRNPAIPPFFVQLLLIELLIGCIITMLGILTRFYRPQLFGAVIILSALFIQIVLSILADGLTSGDYLVLATFFTVVALIRRVRQRYRQTNAILHIHELVDEAARDIKRDDDGSEG